MRCDTGKLKDHIYEPTARKTEPNTEKKMCDLAKKERRYDEMWGVVHPGNALCAGVFRTKSKAEEYRKRSANAYVVVKVIVTPLYAEYLTSEFHDSWKAPLSGD